MELRCALVGADEAVQQSAAINRRFWLERGKPASTVKSKEMPVNIIGGYRPAR
jgi:hypothetical protein